MTRALSELLSSQTIGVSGGTQLSFDGASILWGGTSLLVSSGDGSNLTGLTHSQIGGLGTAALLNVGTAASNIVQLDGSGNLPAVDGSALTGLTQYTASYSANQTLTVAQCRGYIVYVTAAATITLPAVASGMSVTIITIGDVEVSIDPNASDLIMLDGAALDDGDKITNASTAGDIAVLTYYSADGWHASTNGWTDGGA